MEILIGDQIKTIVESCILGLIFGVGYDIIRILHVLLRLRSYVPESHEKMLPVQVGFWVFLLLDLCYMLTVAFCFSVFLFYANYGQFRLFVVLPCIGGFALYYATVGKVVMYLSETIVSFLRYLIHTFVFHPLYVCFRCIYRFFRWVGCICGRGAARVWRFFRAVWRTYNAERQISRMVRL